MTGVFNHVSSSILRLCFLTHHTLLVSLSVIFVSSINEGSAASLSLQGHCEGLEVLCGLENCSAGGGRWWLLEMFQTCKC